MSPWSAQEDRRIRDQEKKAALEEIRSNIGKGKLSRTVFFVPGWTDEFSTCWMNPYLPYSTYVPIKRHVARLYQNYDLCSFVTFSARDSRSCKSFIDFGKILKEKIRKVPGGLKSFDVVGHSMGGLDTIAAILDESDPLEGVNYFITAATPHRGSFWGDACKIPIVQKRRKLKPHQIIQGENLDPDHKPIQYINRVDNRARFLKSIKRLYCLGGTRDTAVFSSSYFDTTGLTPDLQAKVELVERYDGARHAGAGGITQDPRCMRDVLRVLMGKPLDRPQFNYGKVS